MTQINPLTRQEKLLAEICVQLGNVTEAVRAIHSDGDTSQWEQQIADLQTQVATLQQSKNTLTAELAASNTMITQLQEQIAQHTAADVTPDSIAEVIQHLDIQLP